MLRWVLFDFFIIKIYKNLCTSSHKTHTHTAQDLHAAQCRESNFKTEERARLKNKMNIHIRTHTRHTIQPPDVPNEHWFGCWRIELKRPSPPQSENNSEGKPLLYSTRMVVFFSMVLLLVVSVCLCVFGIGAV